MATGRLSDKVALVTGSTRGIGDSMVRLFAREGAKVVVSGRNGEAGRRIAKEISEAGGDAFYVRADVGIERDTQDLVAAAFARYGQLDVVVNNAAPSDFINSRGDDKAHLLDTANFDYLMKTCAYGPFWVAKYAIPHLLDSGRGGSIINISSVASLFGLNALTAYSAAKAALNSMTRTMAVDYGKDGIRVNTIIVGPVDNYVGTDRVHPLRAHADTSKAMSSMSLLPRHGGGVGLPIDVANLALFLASEEAGFVTGGEYHCDGGLGARAFTPDTTEAFDAERSRKATSSTSTE